MRLGKNRSIVALVVLLGISVVTALPIRAYADFLIASDLTDEILRFSDTGAPRPEFVSAGSGGLNSPRDMAWGPNGDLYVAGDSRVLRFNGATGAFVETAYQPASASLFGVGFAPDGTLLVSVQGSGGGRIDRADPVTHSLISSIYLPGTPGKYLSTPDGNVLTGMISGSGTNSIYKINLSNNTTSVFASGSGLNGPYGMDYGPDGKIYVADLYGDDGLYKLDPNTGSVIGEIPSGLTAPTGVIYIPTVNRFWAGSLLNSQLNSYDAATGNVLSSITGGSNNWDLLYIPEPASFGTLCIGLLTTTFTLKRKAYSACGVWPRRSRRDKLADAASD